MDYIVIGKTKDVFGYTCEVWYNETFDEISFRVQNPEYIKRKRLYKNKNLRQEIDIPEYLDVIDFSAAEIVNLRNKFPEYADAISRCAFRLRLW